jgi:hypothetical protein
MPKAVYVGPPWPDGTTEPEPDHYFRCANTDCPDSEAADVPCTRKYQVPGGYICELCAQAHDESTED